MHAKPRQRHHQEYVIASSCVITGANSTHPCVAIQEVTDPTTIDRARLYAEALYQTQPIAKSESEARLIADMIRNGTARPNGLTHATAERMASSERPLNSFINGANPKGKAAEVVATSDYRDLHSGKMTGIVNPPQHVAQNVLDIRLAPDAASRKDLVFGFETKDGYVIWKYNGQVKTGSAQYVSNSLVEMANTPGYGKVAYVDARYVNPDGTPRVAQDAFTQNQASQLQDAGVRFRGIPDLEKRTDQLMADIKGGMIDGLDPIARQELQQLRDDIATAYRARGVTIRIGGSAAISAASAAVLSLIVQLATEGKVEVTTICKSAGIGALFGAGGAAADASLYHLAIRVLEMAPEAAKEWAKQGVAIGFCVLAIGTDVASEIRAAHRGDVTVMGAVGATAAKTAIDLLPLVMAPLGLVGIPVLIGAQVGGRWLIGKAREADIELEQAIAADDTLMDSITQRMSALTKMVEYCQADSADTDVIFNQVMHQALPTASLQFVNN